MLLGVNMQTSFMHPPFGFALFYLRSVAPDSDYVDKVTGKLTAPVTTGQIYWGAVPFVVIQVIMVAIVIAFPKHGDRHSTSSCRIRPRSKIEIAEPADHDSQELDERAAGRFRRAEAKRPQRRRRAGRQRRAARCPLGLSDLAACRPQLAR